MLSVASARKRAPLCTASKTETSATGVAYDRDFRACRRDHRPGQGARAAARVAGTADAPGLPCARRRPERGRARRACAICASLATRRAALVAARVVAGAERPA